MAVTYKDLRQDYDGGHNNMGGTQQIGWYASLGDILTVATPGASPSEEEDEFVIKTPHIMKSGKNFFELYTEVNKGSITYERLGSEDGGGFKATLAIFIPGDSKKLNYITNKVQSSKYIVLMPDSDGLINQLGSEAFPASIKLGKTTETNEGVKGYTGEIVAYMPWKIIYEAAVPTTPAT